MAFDAAARGIRIQVLAALCSVVVLSCGAAALLGAPAAAAAGAIARGAAHDACSGPHSATTPCHFSTPSGNIHCLWTPSPNRVECELLATGRAYRLGATGKAARITLKLPVRGETLPTSQQLVFPEKLSCDDTRTTMTCNQDEGFGEFALVPGKSHSS